MIGTWKLNFEVAGDGIKVTTKGQDAAGDATSTQYTAKYDGKDYPVTLVGTQDFDTLSLKRIDAFKADGTRKQAGKVVQTDTRVVSPDGKTLTLTVDGTDAKGRKVHNLIVYDKQ